MASQSEFDALLGVFVIVVVNFVSMGFLCVSCALFVFYFFLFFCLSCSTLVCLPLFHHILFYYYFLDACFYYNERKEQCRFDWVEK